MVCLVKMVSLSNDAYAILSGLKRRDESFSKVVARLAQKEKNSGSILGFAGTWGNEGGEAETKRIIDQIYNRRHAARMRKLDWR